MKITKTKLREMIQEELLNESKAKVNFVFKGKDKAPKLYYNLERDMKGINSNEFGEFFTSVSVDGVLKENYIESVDEMLYDIDIKVLFENKLNQELQFNYIHRRLSRLNHLRVTMNNKVLSDSKWEVKPKPSGFFKLMFDSLKKRL